MIKCLILDLDGTLIDTSPLMALREKGGWREIVARLDLCSPYPEVLDVVSTVRAAGIKISVVTNSPSNYAQRLLDHFGIKVDYLVAYHDVRRQKPDQEGVQKVISRFELRPEEVVFLGDSSDDLLASRAANVEYFAVEWSDPSLISKANFGVSRLLDFIGLSVANADITSKRSGVIQVGQHFFLGYYLGSIRRKTLDFKNGFSSAVDGWSAKAQEIAFSLPSVDYVVRALGHTELEARAEENKAPLDFFAEKISQSLGASYCPCALKKDRVLVKSTKSTAKERKLQVHGAYSVNHDALNISKSSQVTFLVVDDVFTSGATTGEITRALNESYPNARVYIFTLVKTLYRSEADEASAEGQHNAQLFSDLHSKGSTPQNEFIHHDDRKNNSPSKNGLVVKSFSASYCRTNSNFVFQNIKSFSIASESNSKLILNAVYILKNILQRGNPTVASRRLRKAFGVVGNEQPKALISANPVLWQRLIRGDVKADLYPAKHFFDELIPRHFGDYAFIKQLMVPEVQIFDMTQVYVDRFNNRQVDFYIPQAGLIVEIDGHQHRDNRPQDESRDAFTKTLGLKTIRFTTEEIASENGAFLEKVKIIIEHICTIEALEESGVLVPPNGITFQHYKLALSEGINRNCPSVRLTAAIRFQILLLELIESGEIRLGETVQVFLLNRDQIDFYGHAIDDLNDYFDQLMALLGVDGCKLNVQVSEVRCPESFPEGPGIKVDFSVLERFDDSFQIRPDVIFVRTHYLDFYRKFSGGDSSRLDSYSLEGYDYFEISCSGPISYSLDLSPGSRQRAALRFFLANLFLPQIDDADFREGQVGIIGSALARKGTIGLLPTGSGKSICYQLAAVLQPAVSFVVCPIKSLMYDQKADLDSIGFTRCDFITSDLKPDQKAKVQSDYGRGKYFFVFISPERFQTRQFRLEMKAIGLDRAFAYSVIDEAHCLSEWGHDFRTSYLNLSNAIRRLAPEASCIGLTATASVNVLKDIQAEFQIPDENVRTPLDFTREELSFHVIDDKGRKGDAAVSLVRDMDAKWKSEAKDKAGIIFTPTVNGDKGCFELAGLISQTLGMDARYFSGSAPKRGGLRGDAFERYKLGVQRDFKANKYRLLTATKAFGMGVNKGNVAYTIHFGIPGSMEALYQEAGRAGRDKGLFKDMPADCYVLLTKEKNTQTLDKIWDASAKVSDLRANLEKLSRDSDIKTNLWLQTSNLDTINDEYKLIDRIYAFLEQNSDVAAITIEASRFGSDKFKFERAIYRLYQLGIVSDWMVRDFFKGILDIEFSCINEDGLQSNLETTVRKYEPTFHLSDILSSNNDFYVILNDRLESGSLSKTQYIFLVLLVWSYDHFVYNRRQSLKTVYEQCSDLADKRISEAEFKSRLEGYFKFNNSTLTLHSLAENAADTSQWLTVFFEGNEGDEAGDVISNTKIVALKEQLSRFLESYKDNACLNYISGVLRLASNQFDDADGERRMSRSLDQLSNQPLVEIERIVGETVRLKSLFSSDSQCRFARLIHEKFPDQRMLELINSGFQDSYSYGQLLGPLVSRLETIASNYSGITWQ